jgi:hypothetical protein
VQLCKHYDTFQDIIDIKNPSDGMTAYARNTECTYAYDGWKWVNLDTGEKHEKKESKPINHSTKCQFCGAPLPISKTKNGICKCDWCRSENLVEGIHEEETLEITCLGDSTRRFRGGI